ncbi:MAG: DUF3782 domain-containing protein [Cyanobacteria bacterium]|nr:DUF3782 domain-containing protein [Cyanobacteriota bacterium]MDW8200525.1 DUF3782 domain-containing protein [Cyanobacteriota bacterium SKYGB_h_bin112]
MSNPVTLDDIYALFQRSQAEADRRFVEFDQRAAESRADFDRRMAESKAEFDRCMAESKADFDRRMAESKAEADRRAAEADARLARAEAIAAQANQAVNNLSSRWGRFVENLVAPAVLRLFQSRGIAVQEVYQRVRSVRGNRNLEIDILAVDDDVAVIVEVKSRLTQDSVQQCLQTLEQFKAAFPHYATYRIYGAVAAIEIDGDVDTYAYNQGLFVIQQSGDTVEISNTADFIPRTW